MIRNKTIDKDQFYNVIKALKIGRKNSFDEIYKVLEGVTQAGDSSIKNIYDSIKKSPNYPEGFEGVANATKKVNIKNGDVLDELRNVESGQWKKVYKDGYDANGKKISIHYFQNQSGKVFNVKVKPGWSNK